MESPKPCKKSGRDFTASEKLEIIRRVNAGESKASVGRLYNVPESTLRGWCKAEAQRRAAEQKKFSGQSTRSLDSDKHSSSSGDSHSGDPEETSLDSFIAKKRKLDNELGESNTGGYDYTSQWLSTVMGHQGGAVYMQPTSARTTAAVLNDFAQMHNLQQQSGGFVETNNNNSKQHVYPGIPAPAWFNNINFSPILKFEAPSPDNSCSEESGVLDLSKSHCISEEEAMEYGEKFLEWLINSGSPKVTQLNISQVRNIINRFKAANSPK